MSLSAKELLSALRISDARSDEDVALLVGVYIDQHTAVPLNSITLAGGMMMLAGRRVTDERADHLLSILEGQEFLEEAGP